MYENNRYPQVALVVADLGRLAEYIDALGGDPGTSVAAQLAAADGLTGVSAPGGEPARFTYGLLLLLGEGNRSIAGIRPAGHWAAQPRSRLNSLAPPFVPGSGL